MRWDGGRGWEHARATPTTTGGVACSSPYSSLCWCRGVALDADKLDRAAGRKKGDELLFRGGLGDIAHVDCPPDGVGLCRVHVCCGRGNGEERTVS